MSSERNRTADEVFCRHCGERVAVHAEVCPHCGVRNERYDAGGVGGIGGVGGGSSATDSAGVLTGELGLGRNVAAALSYVLWFVSGIAVYVLEDDDFVRFHAAQSIVVFGGLSVLNVLVGVFAVVGIGSVGAVLSGILSLVGLALWVFLIATAYRGETNRIPVAADAADRLVGTTAGTDRSRRAEREDDALAALRSRYARGEIGDAEFERRLERLLESDEGGRRERESTETERSW